MDPPDAAGGRASRALAEKIAEGSAYTVMRHEELALLEVHVAKILEASVGAGQAATLSRLPKPRMTS